MRIRTVVTEEEFCCLNEHWDKLAENAVPINKFEWMYKWWQHNKINNELKILVAEKNNEIIGIAPLYIQKSKAFKFIPVKKLCFLGGEISDYLDFIIKEDSDKDEIFKLFINFIFNEIKTDEICFKQINSSYPNFYLWKKYIGSRNIDFQSYRECWRIDFDKFAGYEDYFSQLSKSHKRSIKARQKKLNTEVKSHEFIFKSDISQEEMDVISAINIKRQKFLYEEKCKTKRFCYFTDKQKTDFIYDYFCNGDLNDKFLSALKCNGEIASYILCLKNKESLYLWNMAFNPDYEFCSPTKILVNETIKYSFEKGLSYFDFLRGNDPYKLKWSNDTTFCYSFFVPRSIKSKIIQILRNVKPECITKFFNKPNIKSLIDEAYEEKYDS
jgi:CelD/BcsL family acetyltransferase involved in cellulose biosynthesis